MILIAHRGNIDGPNIKLENHPDHITKALHIGFNSEVDVRYLNGEFFLGHDEAQYKVSLKWLLEYGSKLWIHCKTIETVFQLNSYSDLNYFFHESDSVTLTSKNFLWTYPGKLLTSKSIDVMPETLVADIKNYIPSKSCYGICSDYPLFFRDLF